MQTAINISRVLCICLLLVAGQSTFLSVRAENTLFSEHSNELGYATTNKTNISEFLIPGTTIDSYSFGIDEANRLAKDNVFIGSDSKNNYLDLARGNVLLRPEKDMVVSTAFGKINISAGDIVFIIDSANCLIIYDLKQAKTKPVAVVTGKYKLCMQPGRMLILTSENTKEFEQLPVKCHSLPYQNTKRLDLPGQTLGIFTADFSVPAAFASIQPLK